MAATWEVVADGGVEGATLRRIAEVAGCTTGRVTHYFENKDKLLTAFERIYDHGSGHVTDSRPGRGPAWRTSPCTPP